MFGYVSKWNDRIPWSPYVFLHWALVKIITPSTPIQHPVFSTYLSGLSLRPLKSQFQTPVASSSLVFAELETVQLLGFDRVTVWQNRKSQHITGDLCSAVAVLIPIIESPSASLDYSVDLMLSVCVLHFYEQINHSNHFLWHSLSRLWRAGHLPPAAQTGGYVSGLYCICFMGAEDCKPTSWRCLEGWYVCSYVAFIQFDIKADFLRQIKK